MTKNELIKPPKGMSVADQKNCSKDIKAEKAKKSLSGARHAWKPDK